MFFRYDGASGNNPKSADTAKKRLSSVLRNERVITKSRFDDLIKELALSVEKYTRAPCSISLSMSRNNAIDIMISGVSADLD